MNVFKTSIIIFNLLPPTVIMLIGSLCWVIGKVNGFWLAVIFTGLSFLFTLWISVALLAGRWVWKRFKKNHN